MPMAGCHKSRGKYIVTGEEDNSIARKGSRGKFPLAGSRDSVPCGVWGNAPTVPRPTSIANALNKGAGSEASLPVTLRVRRRAPKLLFPQDSVKNQKEETHGRRMEEKPTQSRVNSFSARIGRKKRLHCRIPDCLLMNRGQSLCSERNQKRFTIPLTCKKTDVKGIISCNRSSYRSSW